MNETAFETIASAASVLKLDFSSEEFAGFVEDHSLSEDAIEAVILYIELLGLKSISRIMSEFLKSMLIPGTHALLL